MDQMIINRMETLCGTWQLSWDIPTYPNLITEPQPGQITESAGNACSSGVRRHYVHIHGIEIHRFTLFLLVPYNIV